MTRDEWLERGEGAFEAGDVEGARRAFEAARGIGPPNARLWSNLGVLMHHGADLERARTYFERALALEPNCEVARENLAALGIGSPPDISIVVPTYGRPDSIRDLIEGLKSQTLSSDRFELIIVDDGSRTDLSFIEASLKPSFAVTTSSQENKGPGAARNTGLTHAKADLVLFLNDDGRPDPRLLEEHLAAHREAGSEVAVLGSFPYSEAARESRFVRLIEQAGFTFAFNQMTPKKSHEWCFFWTCNISLKRAHILAVGGFDEAFRDPMSEDIELGWRLQRDLNLLVYYHPEAICHHEHRLTVNQFIKRQTSMGVNAYRLYVKYQNPVPLMLGWLGPYDDRAFKRLEDELAAGAREIEGYQRRLEAWESGAPLVSGDDSRRTRELVFAMCQRLTSYHSACGILQARHSGKAFHPTEKTFPSIASSTPRHVPVLS